MPKITYICLICQKEFRPDKKSAKTCSRSCSNSLRHANARSVTTIEEKFWSYVDRTNPNDCWIWKVNMTEKGYGAFVYQNKRTLAHRFSYLITHKELPENLFVCHSCDNPPCINPSHLWLGTAKDNMQDCLAKGRLTSTNSSKKLTIRKAIEIRRLYSTGLFTYPQLGEMFDVDKSNIGLIVRRKIWVNI